ncbi:unnamed protein product [Choristocarpus tenellus]
MGMTELVPIALVDTGLHLDDRRKAARLVRKGLTNLGRPARFGTHCARADDKVVLVLRPEACSTLEMALSSLLSQCLDFGGVRPRHPLVMHAIREWYNSLYPLTEGGKGGEGGVVRPPVVVLIENVEGVPKQVLTRVLSILVQPPYAHGTITTSPKCEQGFPLALVALVSVGVGFPRDRLSPSTVSQLVGKAFELPSARICADGLFEALFLQGKLPLMPGPGTLDWLTRAFSNSHHSLQTLVRHVDRMVFEHFSRPSSYLCMHHCPSWLKRYGYDGRPKAVLEYCGAKLSGDSHRMPHAFLELLWGKTYSELEVVPVTTSAASDSSVALPLGDSSAVGSGSVNMAMEATKAAGVGASKVSPMSLEQVCCLPNRKQTSMIELG